MADPKITAQQASLIGKLAEGGLSDAEIKQLEAEKVSAEILNELKGKNEGEVKDLLQKYINDEPKVLVKEMNTKDSEYGQNLRKEIAQHKSNGEWWDATKKAFEYNQLPEKPGQLEAKGGLALLGAAIGIAITLASCGESNSIVGEEPEIPEKTPPKKDDNLLKPGDIYVITNINIIIETTTDPALKELLQTLSDQLDKLREEVREGNENDVKIMALLTTLVNNVGQIKENQVEQKEMFADLITLLQNQLGNVNAKLGNLEKYVQQISAQLGYMSEDNAKFHKEIINILKNIDNKNADIKAIAEKALDKLANLESITGEVNNNLSLQHQTVLAILKKLDGLGNQNNLDPTLKAFFEKVLNEIKDFKQGSIEYNKQKTAYLKILVEKADYIIANGDKLGIDVNNLYDLIKAGQEMSKDQFEKLLQAVLDGNKIAQGTQDAVKNLGAKLDANTKEIINRLDTGNVTLSEIRDLLANMKEQVPNMENSLKDAINVVGATIASLLKQELGLSESNKAILLQILAKIPNGCNCKPTDLGPILEKLDKLIEAMENGEGDAKHEGILDDLGQYFG